MRCSKVIPIRLKIIIKLELSVSVFILVFLLAATAAQTGDLAISENLFFIKRSKNANEVHYDARVENCVWSQPEVDYYWRELKDGPKVYKPILFFEIPAYGFEVERLSKSEIALRLKAFPKRAIKARLSQNEKDECSVSVTMEIHGKIAKLRSVYVYAEENFIGWPTVHYIDILGYSEEGQHVFERIPKTDRGREMLSSSPDDSRWKSGATTWGRP
jgi:hypothetical protein